jgi:4-hydroxybenzoate polyprenyltransferase
MAGAVYTLNDLVDIEADRAHPVKRKRPIASGQVPVPVAKVMLVVVLGVALWIIYGVHLGNRVIIIANAVTLVTLLTALGLYFTYRRERPFL